MIRGQRSQTIILGHSNEGEMLSPTIPRLRLPHKMTGPLPETTAARSAQTQNYSFPYERQTTPLEISDMPTNPVHPPLSTFQPPRPGLQRPPQPHQLLQVGIGWDPGIVRHGSPNEDGILALQGMCSYKGCLVPFSLFCIADGMGGHADGQKASRIAIERMMQTVLQNILMGPNLTEEFLTDILIGGAEWANLAIYHQAQKAQKDMGTTLTATLVIDGKAHIINIGDSRTYIYREGLGLTQVTHDHSLVALLVERGQIKPEEIYTHPDRSQIYRCLGNEQTMKIDWFVVDLCPQDRLLLCSDGLWEMVQDVHLARILRSCPQPMEASNRLVQLALQAGGADNISVIVALYP